ncbi:MAG: hypothetical protein D6706_09655 [Chloroflexi bacterium]|nr:MAG: hypothetical protein D6706_09655 [Chloroflexota bacterium]
MSLLHPNEAIAVKVGDVAPDFTLLNTDNRPFSLSAAIDQSPVVLVFYRGDW